MIITPQVLKQIVHPKGNHGILEALAPAMTEILPDYEITSWLRVCHFIGQAAHESDGFNVLEEYASGRAYEGRHDLGNVHAGDGVTYKGRGIFQLTGRANYRAIGAKIGVDLENNPHMAADPELSVHIACLYWNSRKLNAWADQDDYETITKKINGGLNGFDDRIRLTDEAKNLLADQFPDDPAVA